MGLPGSWAPLLDARASRTHADTHDAKRQRVDAHPETGQPVACRALEDGELMDRTVAVDIACMLPVRAHLDSEFVRTATDERCVSFAAKTTFSLH